MDDVSRFVAICEIQAVQAKYFRAIDEKSWNELEQTLAADVTCDFRVGFVDPVRNPDAPPQGEVLHGRDESMTFLRQVVNGVTTAHHAHLPEIWFSSDTQAHAIWPVENSLRAEQGGPWSFITMFGHHRETYQYAEGRWKIATIKVTTLMIEQR